MVSTVAHEAGHAICGALVGVPIRLLVIDLQEPEDPEDPESPTVKKPRVFVNPEVLWHSDTEVPYTEGCLSIPGFRWDCRRFDHVVARGWDLHGEPQEVEGTAMLARAIQHETDHLDGVLFLDRLDPATRKQAMAEIRQAGWFDPAAPHRVKVSPHAPTHGPVNPLFGGVR